MTFVSLEPPLTFQLNGAVGVHVGDIERRLQDTSEQHLIFLIDGLVCRDAARDHVHERARLVHHRVASLRFRGAFGG